MIMDINNAKIVDVDVEGLDSKAGKNDTSFLRKCVQNLPGYIKRISIIGNSEDN